MIRVRPADHTDVDWLLHEMRLFAAYVNTKRSTFPPDPAKARALVVNFIDHHVAFVSELYHPDILFGVRTGFTIAILHPQLFNPEITVLTELFWWVATEHRGTRSGALLLHELERVAKEQADWMVLSLEALSPVKPETLERRGFKLWERTFLREL